MFCLVKYAKLQLYLAKHGTKYYTSLTSDNSVLLFVLVKCDKHAYIHIGFTLVHIMQIILEIHILEASFHNFWHQMEQ